MLKFEGLEPRKRLSCWSVNDLNWFMQTIFCHSSSSFSISPLLKVSLSTHSLINDSFCKMILISMNPFKITSFKSECAWTQKMFGFWIDGWLFLVRLTARTQEAFNRRWYKTRRKVANLQKFERLELRKLIYKIY